MARKSMIPNDKHNEWRRGVHTDEWMCEAVNGGGGEGKGGQRVIKERSQTTEEGMFGRNGSTEDCAIGIRGEGNNRRVHFYHENTQTNSFCCHARSPCCDVHDERVAFTRALCDLGPVSYLDFATNTTK